MHVTFDLTEIQETRLNRLGSNLRQRWRQFVVALVEFAVCIQLFLINPVQSIVQSMVQSRVQSPGFVVSLVDQNHRDSSSAV